MTAASAAVRAAADRARAGVGRDEAGNEYPAYLRRVLVRASSVIESKWPLRESFVEFVMREEGKGEELIYRARVEFFPFVVLVYDGRTGQQICQSLEGNPFEIDGRPGQWDLVGDDE